MEGPFELLDGGFSRCTPAWSYPQGVHVHYHRCYFPRRGRAQTWSAGPVTVLRPGRAYFIPGHRFLHGLCRRAFDVHWLHFVCRDPRFDAAISQLDRVVSWPIEQWRFFEPVYTRLCDLFSGDVPGLAARTQAMLTYFVQPLLERELAKHPNGRLLRQLDRIAPGVALMDQRFLGNPSLSAIAAAAHLSPNYFHRLFRELYHTTPHDYMLQKRMRLARQRLTDGLTVTDAARAAGYPNVFYFSRVYKSHFGFSPRQTDPQHALQP